MASTSSPTNQDTLVTLKINIDGSNRRFKLPLRDLGASTLPDKLRFLLDIPPSSEAIFERYSDSAAAFVTLDPNNASVYKQLYRAAKAKLKLRLKVTINHKTPTIPKPASVEDEQPSPVSPMEDQPVLRSVIEPASPAEPVLETTPAVTYPEKSTYPASISEIQRGLEELHVVQPRPSTASFITATTACSSQAKREMPGSFQQDPSPSMSSCLPTDISAARIITAREKWFAELASLTQERQQALRKVAPRACPAAGTNVSVYSVYCNNCNASIPDVHYHCSTCDDGDFDLCQSCVNSGVLCDSDDHWLIKRFVKNGKVINSTTETIPPKVPSPEFKETVTQTTEKAGLAVVNATRTCNNCICELTEEHFVTCTSCPDFDLCIPCHVRMQHGHHPKHAFEPAVQGANLDILAQTLLAPGRNVSHNAICDGCDKYIYGVRHKCLDCPDWDFCSTCIANASFIHPQHRFVSIYEPLNDCASVSRTYRTKAHHHGIYCDGPLCNASNGPQSYIKGDRYKCAVCHDTDFCASCEASPTNSHNRTHPLIKFKTPVRNVSVTTLGDHEDGHRMPVMGDRRGRTTSKATETTPSSSANAATQVQTVADLQPTETVKAEGSKTADTPELKTEAKELPAAVVSEDLVAHFVRDAVQDGTVLPANTIFEQTWYIRNGGKVAWPAGCSVKFVGGDNMCAVDPEHPASVHELVSAAESTTCYTEVAPGQEAGFTVLMRTPNRVGNFISYWRLTGPEGNKFGHRLWCDVNVAEVATPIVKGEAKTESEGSQMIFPKLEKESPTTSVHEEAPLAAPEAQDDIDEFDDFVDEPIEDEETDDGFMTDEEYDILDASDEEYLAEQSKAAKK